MFAGAAEAKSRAPSPAAVRDAYYSGDVHTALRLAPEVGQRWIAGLAAYRLGRYDTARSYFEQVAGDYSEDEWLRAAAAFWAARAVIADGQPENAAAYLRMAAMSPKTFYGMIAQERLAQEDERQNAPFYRLASLSDEGYWVLGDDYPTPELHPYGGFTLDKALVYAMVRQESRFNPYAVSPAGAVGLMQLMPAAAAEAAGDDNLMTNVIPLFDGPTNLRLGQDYLEWLLSAGVGDYDLLKAVAAYNCGPGALRKAADRLEPGADSLTLIESLPSHETRAYVEQVVAAYWTYRRKFGSNSATLDAAANGDRLIDYRLDV
ncbi:MAG TPA: transglycosylase SLT domain-containing protein [Caulobacteraceae bacterium]